jgi:hypothetical protein
MDVSQSDRISSNGQVRHLSGAFINNWKNTVPLVISFIIIESSDIKEEHNQWDFDLSGWHFHVILGSRENHAL